MWSPYSYCGTLTLTPGLENLGLWTPDPTLKNLDFDSHSRTHCVTC